MSLFPLSLSIVYLAGVFLIACVPIPLQVDDPVDDEHLEGVRTLTRGNVYEQFGNPIVEYEIGARSYLVFEVEDVDRYFLLWHPYVYIAGLAGAIAAHPSMPPHEHKPTENHCLLVIVETDKVVQAEARPHDEDSGCIEVFDDSFIIAADEALAMGYDPAAKVGDTTDPWLVYEALGDTPQGFPWLCHAADQGLGKAQARIADIYYHGWFGFEKCDDRSYMWFSLAADGDDKWSTWSAEKLEARFRNMAPADIGHARQMLVDWKPGQCEAELSRAGLIPKWARMVRSGTAARFRLWQDLHEPPELGDAETQLQLYWGLEEPNRLNWLCRAADQGHPDAQYRLGLLYRHGNEGIRVDPVRAYMWYRIATLYGYEFASMRAESVLENLTAGQAMEAEILLKQWQPGQCERDIVRAYSGN